MGKGNSAPFLSLKIPTLQALLTVENLFIHMSLEGQSCVAKEAYVLYTSLTCL
jgi:hypothetical protein